MKRRILTVALAATALIAPVARAAQPVRQVVYVDNMAHVSSALLWKMEQLTAREVNGPLHRAYPQAPKITFADAGGLTAWWLFVVPQSAWSIVQTAPNEFGYVRAGFPPQAWVRWSGQTASEQAFACEIVDMAVAPQLGGPEPCSGIYSKHPAWGGVAGATFRLPDGSIWAGWSRPAT